MPGHRYHQHLDLNSHIVYLFPQVTKAAWDFLYSVYGGKPVLPVDEA